MLPRLLYCAFKWMYERDGHWYTTGGFPEFVTSLSSYFAEIRLMVPRGEDAPRNATRFAIPSNLEIFPTKPTFVRGFRPLETYLWSLGTVSLFRRLQSESDIVLIAIPNSISYLAFAPILDKPLVLLVAGDEFEVLSASGDFSYKLESASGLIVLRRIASRLLYDRSRLVICRNERARRFIVDHYGIPASAVRSIFSGVRTDTFRPVDSEQRSAVRASLGFSPREVVFGFVAEGFTQAKGADALLEVFKTLHRSNPIARLLIVGSVPEYYQSVIKGLHSVLSVGPISRDQLYMYYGAMDVFVCPSRSEGAPKVVMEAAACGIPVVATDVGGIPEMIENERTGFVVGVDDVCSMIRICRRLCEDRQLRSTMGNRARQLAESDFNFNSLVEKSARAILEAL